MEERELYNGHANLAIKVGVELRPGQQLFVIADVEHAPLARPTMEAGVTLPSLSSNTQVRTRCARQRMTWTYD